MTDYNKVATGYPETSANDMLIGLKETDVCTALTTDPSCE